MQVKFGQKFSNFWKPKVGTIQGSCLSAILFCLVTIVMDQVITEKRTVYADDSIVVLSRINEAEMKDKLVKTIEEVSYFIFHIS